MGRELTENVIFDGYGSLNVRIFHFIRKTNKFRQKYENSLCFPHSLQTCSILLIEKDDRHERFTSFYPFRISAHKFSTRATLLGITNSSLGKYVSTSSVILS